MIYVLYQDSYKEYVCKLNSDLPDVFARHGCVSVSESKFCDGNINPGANDKIIVLVSLKNDECKAKLEKNISEKYLYSIDECKSDNVLFRTQLEFCSRFGVKTIINTYDSDRNREFLNSKEIRSVSFPLSGKPRNVSMQDKDINVLVSGQMDVSYYPVRTKIRDALVKYKDSVSGVGVLSHCGFQVSGAVHHFYHNKFYELLDRCWLGVTCRAGHKDRLLAKYVEFGFSKVLPIGDVPSYMPCDMKESMIEVNAQDSDRQIIDKINDALANKSGLVSKIEKYHVATLCFHDVDVNVKKVLESLS